MALDFAKRLVETRKSKGMTQEKLAVAANISTSTLSAYERLSAMSYDDVENDNYYTPRKHPTIYTARKIANTLGVSLDWLCGIDDAKYEQFTNYETMLRVIAHLLENDAGLCKVVTGVVEQFDDVRDYDGASWTFHGDEYYFASICTKEIDFEYFITEYKDSSW